MTRLGGLGETGFGAPGGERQDPGNSGGLRIRTRLALLYGTLFLACGAVLLFVQYLAVNRILGDKGQVITSVPFGGVSDQSGAAPASPLRSTVPTSYQPAGQADMATVQAQVKSGFVDFKSLVLDSLVGQSLITLGLLALAATGLGWWTAGRSLARLHTVTSAARRISERNLHDRLALVGPDDEIKELGDTFDAMLGRLERGFAANRRFAANASHELHTPLALQRTSLEIPLAEGRVPDDLRPFIERSLRATERSERLVGSLLMLAKGQQGPERYAETDLADLARAAVDTYRADAESAGIVVTTDLERAPTAGDPVLLEQVVANLVQNAVRHNAPGPDGHGHIQVTTDRTGHGVELRVANSGLDIDRNDVDQLFEPFHRGTAARLAAAHTGTGLGLSIVRAVVDSHGGHVTAQPRPDGGLTVTVRLLSRRSR